MLKVKKQYHTSTHTIEILSDWDDDTQKLLAENRSIKKEQYSTFFHPTLNDLGNPLLLPDMQAAVDRILQAKNHHERIVIFGDYDVDGVSSTALLVRFLHKELGCEVSFRLPHRVKDGYGLKSYFFNELQEKNVSLVITVDCGTRDIEPIQYAKSLGIDVIVTDHHSVPEIIPKEVVGIINPKRTDSLYKFRDFAGSGVAFKLVHALVVSTISSTTEQQKILQKYIDFAALGTVSDCMPLVGENRTITKLGLAQMPKSESIGLQNFCKHSSQEIQDNADIIGFHIGPRINASGRMDTPITALQWLLAGAARADDFFEELEQHNINRQSIVRESMQHALKHINTETPVIFFLDETGTHGIIGLISGKLTETYHRPSIVLCPHTDTDGTELLVASCRSPEWCDLVELLDACKSHFLRYGGHRQAAGFTLYRSEFEALQQTMQKAFSKKYDITQLPRPTMYVESIVPVEKISLALLDSIDMFRPFGIGNSRPFWLLENITPKNVRIIGKEENHLSFSLYEAPHITLLFWQGANMYTTITTEKHVSLVIELQRNIWNNQVRIQGIVHAIALSNDNCA